MCMKFLGNFVSQPHSQSRTYNVIIRNLNKCVYDRELVVCVISRSTATMQYILFIFLKNYMIYAYI